MAVAMMRVRIVGMGMRQHPVLVRMRVPRPRSDRLAVGVPVMRVVPMLVGVLQWLVRVPVLVPLGTAFEDDPVQQVLARRLPWLSQGEVFSEHAFGVGDWPSQGWKLHVSATPLAGPEVLERVVPLLLDEGARFKVVNTRLQLVVLNGGGYGFSQVGKFVTVYPCESDRPLASARRNLPRNEPLGDGIGNVPCPSARARACR
jgi:hypothetical protein